MHAHRDRKNNIKKNAHRCQDQEGLSHNISRFHDLNALLHEILGVEHMIEEKRFKLNIRNASYTLKTKRIGNGSLN
jgi:hypothetical protein